MTPELHVLEQKLETFRSEVSERFDKVHDDLKDLTKALRELIRLDGDIRRLQDAVGRIGRQTDDHETRLRALEVDGAGARVKVGVIGRGQMLFVAALSSVLTGVLTGVIVYAATH